jgi:hypothetical protein
VVVAFHADRIDQADVELPRDDHRGRHAAARDRHDRAPGPAFAGPALVQPPGQRARIAVDLVPGDVKALLVRQRVDHGLASVLASSVMSGASGFFMPMTL